MNYKAIKIHADKSFKKWKGVLVISSFETIDKLIILSLCYLGLANTKNILTNKVMKMLWLQPVLTKINISSSVWSVFNDIVHECLKYCILFAQ